VLIIDDDPLFQEELTGALVGAGYRVENAKNPLHVRIFDWGGSPLAVGNS
jgi:CheY-like chemotaxis protein